VVLSDTSAAVDAERKLRALVTPGSRTQQAFRVEVHPRVASLLLGPAGSRLAEIEAETKRRFFLETTDEAHGLEHFAVLAEGKLDDLRPAAPVAEGDERELKLVEVGLHDATAGVGKVDGYDVVVGGAAKLVGKKARVRVERVLAGAGYASWLDAPSAGDGTPLTAEAEAEKPTRQVRPRKATGDAAAEVEQEAAVEAEVEVEGDAVAEEPAADGAEASEAPAKKKTRRGSRGGRGRKRPAAGIATDGAEAEGETEGEAAAEEPVGEVVAVEAPVRRIHVPDSDLGRDGAAPAEEEPRQEPESEPAPAPAEAEAEAEGTADGEQPKKKTRRGTRGGRGRRKKPADAASENGVPTDEEAPAEAVAEAPAEPVAEAPAEPADSDAAPARDDDDEWGYVPMAEWEDDFLPDSRPRR
jgi:predicted RNA-binding protein with TRAM domain